MTFGMTLKDKKFLKINITMCGKKYLYTSAFIVHKWKYTKIFLHTLFLYKKRRRYMLCTLNEYYIVAIDEEFACRTANLPLNKSFQFQQMQK